MTTFEEFGGKIREYRNKKEESLSNVASSLNIDKTYLSKLENGHLKPSKKLLEKISNHYSLEKKEIESLYDLAGYGKKEQIMQNKNESEVTKMDQNPSAATKGKEGAAEISVPNNIQVLYSNSVFVTSDDFGVVLDFAQRLGSTSKHTVVSRIGMSTQHAETLVKILKDNIEDHRFKKAKKLVA